MSLGFAEHDKRIFSIPAGADFLGDLADALAREFDLANNTEALADALIYVPNRRSERALAFAVHRAAGGKACLLPMIRALGDLETSDPPPSAEAALADLPPVISPAERLGRLTRLVMAYFEATVLAFPPAPVSPRHANWRVYSTKPRYPAMSRGTSSTHWFQTQSSPRIGRNRSNFSKSLQTNGRSSSTRSERWTRTQDAWPQLRRWSPNGKSHRLMHPSS